MVPVRYDSIRLQSIVICNGTSRGINLKFRQQLVTLTRKVLSSSKLRAVRFDTVLSVFSEKDRVVKLFQV
jgi:hypothetical protein